MPLLHDFPNVLKGSAFLDVEPLDFLAELHPRLRHLAS